MGRLGGAITRVIKVGTVLFAKFQITLLIAHPPLFSQSIDGSYVRSINNQKRVDSHQSYAPVLGPYQREALTSVRCWK